jgi:hypothetical protein
MSISQNYPTISPSLDLSFALTKKLDPRISFSRPTVGGYYDGKTVAKAEENLVKFSGDLTNAVWEKSINGSATTPIVTAGQTDPAGGSTAFRIQATRLDDSSASLSVIQQSLPSAAPKTNSIWIKSNTGVSQSVCFGFTVETAITATTDWQRLSIFTTNISFASTFRIGTRGAVNTDQSVDILVWQPQSEQRSAVTAYTPTTTQPITNYIPTLLSAPANVARFDHNPTTGESLGLLVEEQRTNLVLRSEEFNDAGWTKTRSSITANTIVAPDGTLTGDKLVEDLTSINDHYISGSASVTSGTTYTASAYVKKAERGFALLALVNGFPTTSIQINLTSGAVTTGTGTPLNSFSQNVGNGWFRVGFSLASNATTTTSVRIYASTDGLWNNRFYTGDGYSGIYIWGAQLEAGAFPTSYIKTEASQVTRSADSASMVGSNFSSWYRQDEGTVYGEFMNNGVNSTIADFSVASGNPTSISLYTQGTNANFYLFANGSIQANIISGAYLAKTNTKLCGAYKVDNVAASSLGKPAVLDTSAYIPQALAQFFIGRNPSTSFLNGYIKKIAYYPARLSNENLVALTS